MQDRTTQTCDVNAKGGDQGLKASVVAIPGHNRCDGETAPRGQWAIATDGVVRRELRGGSQVEVFGGRHVTQRAVSVEIRRHGNSTLTAGDDVVDLVHSFRGPVEIAADDKKKENVKMC